MSSRGGRISRAYAKVQSILTQYLNGGYDPTTRDIQRIYYGDQFNSDSSSQYSTIYQCIERGRRLAIKKWHFYLESREFIIDLEKIYFEAPDECEQVMTSDDWKEYIDKLNVEGGPISPEVLDRLPALEVLFEQRMYQFSDEGTNFVISGGNPFQGLSRWFRPSRSGWNIREAQLYRNTIKTLDTQLRRGIVTQVKLATGDSLQRMLQYTKPMIASLEDGTSWICAECGTRNLGDTTSCVICGHPNEFL